MEQTINQAEATVITSQAFIEHWQGHRRLTRKVIEAFPEKELFNFSIGGMRSFAELVQELLAIEAPGVKGIATNEWKPLGEERKNKKPETKEEILRQWDEATEQINEYWKQISPQRFRETTRAFN
ncbi:MAG TPA: DinB family protein, partial [Flavisolibacter sp.]|nr:DinB family protein [Flavisolibacter sp.]